MDRLRAGAVERVELLVQRQKPVVRVASWASSSAPCCAVVFCAGSARRSGVPTSSQPGSDESSPAICAAWVCPARRGVAGGLHLVAAGGHSRFPRKTRTGGANVALANTAPSADASAAG